MKAQHEHIRDLSEIRSMMERSTKFLSLTGWSGIMAGVYALAGVYIADSLNYTINGQITDVVLNVFLLALAILVLAVGTAIFLSYRKTKKLGENLWNPASRRLAVNMAIPLATGGMLILIVCSKGLMDLVLPLTLIFYGSALLNASKFTYEEIKYLGLIEIVLGLSAAYFIEYGLLFWAIGFGIMHIIYGIYLHLRYEK